MTQPLFDPAHWDAFLKRIGGKSPVPIVVGIWPLTSYKQALRLNNEVPGISIPEPVLKELESPGRPPAIVGLPWPAACFVGPLRGWRGLPHSAIQEIRGSPRGLYMILLRPVVEKRGMIC